MSEPKRCIDAERLKKVINLNFGGFGGAQVMMQLIDAQPTESVEPVMHGVWKQDEMYIECDLCHAVFPMDDSVGISGYCFHFCPNCGAQMREEEQSD